MRQPRRSLLRAPSKPSGPIPRHGLLHASLVLARRDARHCCADTGTDGLRTREHVLGGRCYIGRGDGGFCEVAEGQTGWECLDIVLCNEEKSMVISMGWHVVRSLPSGSFRLSSGCMEGKRDPHVLQAKGAPAARWYVCRLSI